MALWRTLSKRVFHRATTPPFLSPATPTTVTVEAMLVQVQPHRAFFTAPPFFRRYLQRSAINRHSAATPLPSTFLALPIGEKLRENLKSRGSTGDHRHGVSSPLGCSPPSAVVEGGFGVSAADAKRLLRLMQVCKVRERIRNIPASTIQYGEFVRMCGDVCGDDEIGSQLAKALDESGNVIVLGDVVFLHPDQVAKSMEELLSNSTAMPNDPRREELAQLQTQKALIDKSAQFLVLRELYCGLGFLVAQTLGFMRLTFWEVSWDVMEPICFFVTTLYSILAYAFFLRTSKEPNFEGFFQRRLRVKQKKLMRSHNFDLNRYNQLLEAFYPKCCDQRSRVGSF